MKSIEQQIDKFIDEYHNSQDFSKLIKDFENTIKEIAAVQDAFILTVDSSKEEFIIWSEDKHIFIEDMEDNISIILDSYYRKKLHFVENLTTSFIYNRRLDQLVEYKLKDLLINPILNHEKEVAYIIWLAHPMGSQEKFSFIDLQNIENFAHAIEERLPIKEEPKTPQLEEETKKIHNNPLNILIVDDNTIILRFLSIVLQKEGFHVELGRSGMEALRLYETIENIDIIFMDEIMHGGISGHETIERIRSLEADNKKTRIPIIALTSDTSKDTRQLLLASGCDRVLYKPIDQEHIINTISQLIVLYGISL